MADKIKIRVKTIEDNGVVKALMLIKHPMESGMRKDQDGNLISVHHLKEVSVVYKNETVFHGEFGTGASKDPFVIFHFEGVAGEKFEVNAVDSKGITGTKSVKIKKLKKKK